MTEKSMLWTAAAGAGDGAATYTEAETTRLFRRLVTGTDNEGVLPDPDEELGASGSNELAVSGTSSPVDVEAGDGWCHGYYYWSTAAETVAIATPVGSTRIDRIVLRATFADDEVRITRIAGTEGAGVPAMTQNATYWDVPLAQCSITTGGVITVTDEREYVHFNTKVSEDMLDASVAGSGLGGSDGSPLAVNVDDSTIEVSSDTLQVKAGGIDTNELANDAVDDTKAGDRVPQLYRRQGGSSTNWNSPGSTTYTPGAVRMQCGATSVVFSSSAEETVAVTFPTAFSYAPIVLATAKHPAIGSPDWVMTVSSTSASQVTLRVDTASGSATTATINIYWLAIGPQ